jgi:muramoyltetrapeptide carboxypeptidase
VTLPRQQSSRFPEPLEPSRLSHGATIGVVSLSAPVAADCPRRFERGCQALRDLGYDVRVPDAARTRHRYMAGSVEARVKALVELWDDDSVDAIISVIGGSSTHQLLEYVPYERLARKPKAFIGYSDTTTLQLALYSQVGLVSFYGPAIMPQFGEFGGPHEYTLAQFQKALHTSARGAVDEAPGWIEERLPWERADTRPRALISGSTRRCVRGGAAEGRLIVANAGCLCLLAGTRYFPDLNGAILILEEDETEKPETVDRFFTHLRHLGVFQVISALGVGRFPKEVGLDDATLDELLERAVGPLPIPILAGLEVGHVDPITTLPIGVRAILDAGARTLTLSE